MYFFQPQKHLGCPPRVEEGSEKSEKNNTTQTHCILKSNTQTYSTYSIQNTRIFCDIKNIFVLKFLNF